MRALSLRSKDRVQSPSRTAILQMLHHVGTNEGSLLGVQKPSSMAPMHSEPLSATSRWHMQGLSPQGLKTEVDYPHAASL